MKIDTPVILITFLRPDTTLRILKIIKENNIQNLFIFNDGPRKNTKDIIQIKKVRNIIDNFSFNKKINKMYKEKNIGLKNNIPKALDWVFRKFDRAIILECDCIPHKNFFRFCELLLKKYKNDLRISQISGTNLIHDNNFIRRNNDSYFFSKLTPCWGWATWKDRWVNTYDLKMKSWPIVKKENWINDIFQTKEKINYWKKIFNRRYKEIDNDWDRIWTYANLINNRISIIPSKNLISNTGYDSFAAHKNPSKWKDLKIDKINFPLKHPIIIHPDNSYDDFIMKAGFSNAKLTWRIKNKIKKILNIH